MRVLGLDPGLTRAGFGLVERKSGEVKMVSTGAIRTPPGPVPARLAQLFEEVTALIDSLRPDSVAVERVLFSANAKTAMSVGQAAGVCLLAASQAGCDVTEYSPNEVKLAVTGYGQADKRQMQKMVARILGLDHVPKPADAADALGLAITHLSSHQMKKKMKDLAARA